MIDWTSPVDIRPDHLEMVQDILRAHLPAGFKVWVFGSRANWTTKDSSDLDLAVEGDARLDHKAMVGLEIAFEESDLPYNVDVVDLNAVSPEFKRIVEGQRVSLPSADGLAAVNRGCHKLTLGDVAQIFMGQSPLGETVSNNQGIALLNGPTEFGSHHPSPVQFTTDPRKFAEPGDILFCVRGSTTGRMNWADQEYAIGRGIAAIRHREESMLQPLVRGVIEIELPELLAQATGSTFPNVSASQLAEIPYPNLDKSEQRAIARVLGTLDDKIDLNRRMNQTLEAMARTLFQDWFVDFGPVRAKLEGREPYLPPELWALFPDWLGDSELGEIPEGWGVGVLNDSIEILSGGTPRTSVSEYWDGDIPWYTAKDAPASSDIFVMATERAITQAGVDNSSTNVLLAGTTTITARGTVGRLACLGIPMAMNQTCYGIRGASGYPDYFTYWNVRNTVSELQARTHGTIFDTITRETFKIAETVLVPIDVAQAFESVATALMKRILNNLKESCSLTAQRDVLLPKLVLGEVWVGDAAIAEEILTP